MFGVSSAIAGLGGTLLTQADQNWDPHTFYPIFGLFWFTAVVVCGVSSIRGAILAAALYVAVPRITDQDVQSAVGLFGLGALFLGRLPGGIIGQLERVPTLLGGWLARAGGRSRPSTPAPARGRRRRARAVAVRPPGARRAG